MGLTGTSALEMGSFGLIEGGGVIAAYLLGAVPFGLALVRAVAKIDVRDGGSGNIGATNVARVAGKRLGVATLLLDLLKGLLPVFGARWLGVEGAALGAVGLAAVVGHCFPVYLGFRGGKGVATGLGVFVALTPLAAAAGAVGYLIAFVVTKISSVGSMTLIGVTLLVSALLAPPLWPLIAEAAVGALIIARHHENIGRLLRGQESRL